MFIRIIVWEVRLHSFTNEGISSSRNFFFEGHFQPIGVLTEIKGSEALSDFKTLEDLTHLHVSNNSKEHLWLQHKIGLITNMDTLLNHQQSAIFVEPNIVLSPSPSLRPRIAHQNSVIWVGWPRNYK